MALFLLVEMSILVFLYQYIYRIDEEYNFAEDYFRDEGSIV